MLPAPPGDDINKVIKPVEVSGLDDTFNAINILTQIVERGTGATAMEKGTAEPGVQTLGEVNVLVGKAVERTIAMAKFYRMAWFELCTKWAGLMHANPPKSMNLRKISREGKVFPKRVYSSEWMSEAGYEPTISSSSEHEMEQTKGIQKFMFILQQFPNNIALREIAQKRMLEILDLTPEELRMVKEAEEQQPQLSPMQPQPGQMNQIAQSPEAIPATPNQDQGLMQDIEQSIAQLNG